MKQIIFAIVLIFATLYLAQGEECQPLYLTNVCGGFNSTCGYNKTTQVTYRCQSGFYCSKTKPDDDLGLCLELVDIGERCTNDEQCGKYAGCENEVCTETKFAALGEDCQFTYQCFSKLICSITTNKCTNSSNKCEDDYDCQYNQYCKDSVCRDPIPVGGKCGNDDECGTNNFCEKLADGSKVCTLQYSLGEGALCSNDNQPHTSCDVTQDLLCVKGICSKLNPQNEQPTSSDYKCNGTTTSQCQSFEQCDCTSEGDGGRCYQVDGTPKEKLSCAQATRDFYTCLSDNQCHYTKDLVSPSSCLLAYCSTQYCDSLSSCSYPDPLDQVEGCQYISNKICDLISGSNSLFAPILSIVLVAILSLVFF